VIALDVRTGETAWTVDLGEHYVHDGQSWLAYDDGVVFAIESKGVLRALDIDTGEQRWVRDLPDQVSSAPTARDGVLYLEDYNRIYALRTVYGSSLWTVRPYGVDGWSAPAVDADSVYFGWACENTYR